ncbi:MAG: hypothetical protein KBT19_08065 [Lachnospiraceae bacterium]|nr:hypothetical protein [Candidatus Colinaster equi]
MGNGYGFKCKRCNREYEVLLGCGKRFSEEYQQTIEEVKRFKYGVKWRNLVKNRKNINIDVEYDLYQCECGYWKVKRNLSIFEPIDETNITTSEEYPLVTRWERKEGKYRLVAENKHKCRRCRKPMHVIKEEDIDKLPCPRCGELNESETFIRWD